MVHTFTHQPWHVLLLEDDEDDYILARTWLAAARAGHYDLIWTQTKEDALQVMAEKALDAILVDYDLGLYSGLDFVREALEHGCQAPIILLTGHGGYEVDLEAMQVGVTDYLSKAELTPQLLERTIRYAIAEKRTEAALRESNRLLESANQELEVRVRDRTEELLNKNESLMAEIVQRKRAELELAEVQRRMLDRTETERLELAQELHDGPMQELYALSYQIAAARNKIADEALQGELKGSAEKLQGVIQALRSMAGELRPPALAPYGLEKAIRSHVDNIAQSQNLECKLEMIPDENTLPEPVRLGLFRIYQVAMTNVVRHSQAKQVVIKLDLDEQKVILEVSDDGKGFELPQRWYEFAHAGHLGLVGAQERANALGGQLEVDSRPGQGTCVRVVVPRSGG